MTGWDAEDAPARPLWLVTLADLGLLLVAFFVLLQANRDDPRALAAGIRAALGTEAAAMPVELATVRFASGANAPAEIDAAIAWARAAARDPRTRLTVTGQAGAVPGDVDPASRSAAVLAADRASRVARALAASGAVSADRIAITTARGAPQAMLTIGYQGAAK